MEQKSDYVSGYAFPRCCSQGQVQRKAASLHFWGLSVVEAWSKGGEIGFCTGMRLRRPFLKHCSLLAFVQTP